MDNNICPLLLMSNPSNVQGLADCKKWRCAWYYGVDTASLSDGCCAVQVLAITMPELMKGVRKL